LWVAGEGGLDLITHYDLFAGIGGFSLALEEVFKDATIRHIFCEWEQFPTSVLRRHWPAGEFYGDIADLVTDTKHKGLQKPRQTGQHTDASQAETGVDDRLERQSSFTIVTGGFPCQPFSAAGRRRGTADDRYQWPNMFEVIRNTKPDWVIAENVRGLVTWNEGMVLETVCADLESEGYEVQPFIIPAVAVGAPHRRDRVWIIASKRTPAANARPQRRQAGGGESLRPEGLQPKQPDYQYPDWQRNWQEVAFATCDDTVDDGLPRLVDGVPVSRARWRKDSLKAYGNGIVPEVAMNIMQAIKNSVELDTKSR
jgi:DNA (cytosine-5)-methyltransferase 1